MWTRVLLVVGLLAGQAASQAPRDSQNVAPSLVSDIPSLISAYAASGRVPDVGVFSPAEARDVINVYQAGGYAPLWVSSMARPTSRAREALSLIDHVAANGLDPADYVGATLHRLDAALRLAPAAKPQEVAAFDVALSWSVLRYFRQVHLGRIDPAVVGFRTIKPTEPHDFAAILRAALTDDRLLAAAAGLAPALAQYQALLGALARYQSLAADASLEPPPAPAKVVHPGERYAGISALLAWLAALGDLPADTPAAGPAGVYGDALVEGVKRFQARHGLAADGVLGRATVAALRVPLGTRARQIELALERLRWLPDLTEAPFVVLNIPMFHLWAWDAPPRTGTPPSIDMDAIVGRAVATETPVLVGTMREIIFRPAWFVPTSILRKEMLPAIARDPDYLEKNALDLIEQPTEEAAPLEPTPDNLARLRRGELQLRQRPGPQNSLGLVKFVFPNDEDVYMHATPARALFGRARRDFSHGCVRLEQPEAMAQWVLRDQPEWSRDQILEAMNGDATVHVKLTRPIQVILFYNTAGVTSADGTLHFADDIYRQDARLERALTRAQAVR